MLSKTYHRRARAMAMNLHYPHIWYTSPLWHGLLACAVVPKVGKRSGKSINLPITLPPSLGGPSGETLIPARAVSLPASAMFLIHTADGAGAR